MMNLFSKRNLVGVFLFIYTYLNMRILYPFLFGSDHIDYLLGTALRNGGVGLLAIILTLFLNAATILYFLRD